MTEASKIVHIIESMKCKPQVITYGSEKDDNPLVKVFIQKTIGHYGLKSYSYFNPYTHLSDALMVFSFLVEENNCLSVIKMGDEYSINGSVATTFEQAICDTFIKIYPMPEKVEEDSVELDNPNGTTTEVVLLADNEV